MKRRQFIRSTGTVLSLPILLKGMPVSAMDKTSIFEFTDPDNDRILVLIQLNGGTDGLNMILPTDQYDNLVRVRGNILMPESRIGKLTDATGMHPAMEKTRLLYEEGKLGVIQSVGYPNQDRSHFRSMDIWQSASPATEFWHTGWLGRHFDSNYPDFPQNYPNTAHPHPFAVSMGRVVSETCEGPNGNFSITLDDPFKLIELFEGMDTNAPNTPYGEELAFLRVSKAQTNAYSESIVQAAGKGGNTVTYPDNTFARQLSNIALLISGGLSTKVYVVSLGGFDTHANQVEENDKTTGEHAVLLQTLSEGMAAFQQDLSNLGLEQRVLGMTFSEFGRRIRSNESMGTDHGTAVPLLLFGSCVNPQILGQNPEIDPEVDVREGLPMQYDFRDVYGSVLRDWFGVADQAIREMIHPDFQPLPILNVCNLTTSTPGFTPAAPSVQALVYPNPCQQWLHLDLELPDTVHVRITLLDAMGGQLAVLASGPLSSGLHQVPVEMRSYAAGTYFIRIQYGSGVLTRRFIKVRS
jgi:uncharacterized protein (DUF1501 family)